MSSTTQIPVQDVRSATRTRRPQTLWRGVRRVFRRDPILRLVWVVLAMTGPLLLSPWWSLEVRLGLVAGALCHLVLGLAVVALVWRLRQLELRAEQRFWTWLVVAHGSLLAATLGPWLLPRAQAPAVVEVLRGVATLAFFLALEGHPHHLARRDPPPGETLLRQALLVLVLVGYLAYFVWVPLWIGQGATQSTAAVPEFYFVLDALVVACLAGLAWGSVTPRWRGLFGLLACSRALAILAGLLAHRFDSPLPASLAEGAAWSAIVVAAGLRHVPFERTTEPLLESEASHAQPARIGLATLYLTLAFPVVHIVLYGMTVLEKEHRGAREILIALWLPLLALVAFQQHWTLRRYGRQQLERRARVSLALQQSHANLRLMSQKQEAATEQRKADERFASFFRISPTGLLICSLEDNQVVEVNTPLQQILGRTEEELVGHPLAELDLWGDPEEGVSLLTRAAEGRPTHRRRVELRTARGSQRQVLLSVVAVEMGEGPSLLMVFRDVTPYAETGRNADERKLWRHDVEREALVLASD